jgi:fucose permease
MMIFAGGTEGAFTFWSASYIQVNFASDARMGGIGTACFAAGMMVMRFAGGLFVGQKRLRRFILASAVCGMVIGLGVPFIRSPWLFFPILFAAGLSIACFWPSIQSYAVDRLPGKDPTAVFILLSCAGIPGFGLTSVIMGMIGDHAGLGASFLIVPLMLLFLAVTVLAERARKLPEEA